MRIRAEAQIRLALPVLQIVPRFESRPREIGNLIALQAQPREAFDRSLIEIGDGVFAGNIACAIA